MIQPVLPQHRIQGNGAVLRRLFERCLRIANVRGVLERFEALQVVSRDDDRDGLAMSLDDDPLSPVLGAAQKVREVVLGVGDSHVGHFSNYSLSGQFGHKRRGRGDGRPWVAQARFDAFVTRYNQDRPHQALGMKVPRISTRAHHGRIEASRI